MDAEVLAEVRKIFLGEAQDILENLVTDLLRIDEVGGREEECLSTFRGNLHTLKGASSAASFPAMKLACHALEDVCDSDLEDPSSRRFLFEGIEFLTLYLHASFGIVGSQPPRLLPLLQGSPVPLNEKLLEMARDLEGELEPGDLAGNGKVPSAASESGPPARPLPADSERRPSPGKVASGEAPSNRGTEPSPGRSEPSLGPEEAGEGATNQAYPSSAAETSYRVPARTIDTLLEEIGEALLSVSSLENLQRELRSEAKTRRHAVRLERDLDWMRRHLLNFQETARSLRMIQADAVKNPVRLALRQVLESTGKKAEVHLRGGTIRLDRALIDRLQYCLLHLINNAVDHGLETPEARREAGKPEVGTISIRFSLLGGVVRVQVDDDGQGISLDGLRNRLLEEGFETENSLKEMRDPEILHSIFQEGLSSRREVTAISGRGVGLSTVREQVQSLGGTISVDSDPGKGTTFLLEVPLVTTTISALLIRVGGQRMAVPLPSVERVLAPGEARVVKVGETPCVEFGKRRIGCRSLYDLLSIPSPNPPPLEDLAYLVVGRGDDRLALGVDQITEQRQLVFRPLGERFRHFDFLSGATILGNGDVAVVLNPSSLSTFRGRVSERRLRPKDLSRPRVLVVDDSVTMMNLTSSLLERRGYEILQATNGAEALKRLQESDKVVDLVVTDIDMPRMDGISLTRGIRSGPFAETPIVIVTSNSDDKTRQEGMDAGANAYLVKGDVDGAGLVEAVDRLLGTT